ncbi:16S rRNA (uracil(1498)-N(3))-methyltransferase [Allopusillimonas soli]|uniref:Ribosomal RNA small subunit methyltransferase E n=1 Tax=Allopusillimonas soli TaxID=659016 RepID=A0A853FCH4_9BURK|nr:16S rRNA (uracil(1498)-N(3))-methyltransferase [Allopusillimonas soli]NYT38495.1 16S rRNA (uracil(1498)-N(3))-methyltransferase [Allopusillimonas soli]TEA71782.1 16S rRNA (uracil(1498)-N(3))-methyltransferase [Allopusillimonas soli]
MPTPRFFLPPPLTAAATIRLPDALAHHALRVLRLRDNASIILFDGRGGQFPATLQIHGKGASAILGAHDPAEAELAGQITLVQGIASGDKMDWVIEKAVELGACAVVPIAAHRSVLQLSGDRLRKRMAHWRRIAQAASEQSGRNRIMRVDEPRHLAHYLEEADATSQPALFCHPDASSTLAHALHGVRDKFALLVGPEGGWSEEEQALARARGLQPVSFGKRVLRTETAGLALMAACSALLGW